MNSFCVRRDVLSEQASQPLVRLSCFRAGNAGHKGSTLGVLLPRARRRRAGFVLARSGWPRQSVRGFAADKARDSSRPQCRRICSDVCYSVLESCVTQQVECECPRWRGDVNRSRRILDLLAHGEYPLSKVGAYEAVVMACAVCHYCRQFGCVDAPWQARPDRSRTSV